jgi:RNA polymerase sporulation-specific sigma factor
MTLPKKGRDNDTIEEKIVKLIEYIRVSDNEAAFVELKIYLDPYIKLFGRKYKIAGHDKDEIEQECLYALRYKAIEDFNTSRGKFKSFAILCIKRHLFSLIKSNNQQKRRPLNQSLSLDEDRSEGGENLSLSSLVPEDGISGIEELERDENYKVKLQKLLGRLSDLEQDVLKLYLMQLHYDEMVEKLQEMYPDKKISAKTCDNSLVRVRLKAREMSINLDWI